MHLTFQRGELKTDSNTKEKKSVEIHANPNSADTTLN